MTNTAKDMELDEVLKAVNVILNINSKEDLKMISMALKTRWSEIEYEVGSKLTIGKMVKFMTKRGTTVQGRVTKVNMKTVKVVTDGNVVWTVSPSLLSAA